MKGHGCIPVKYYLQKKANWGEREEWADMGHGAQSANPWSRPLYFNSPLTGLTAYFVVVLLNKFNHSP